jgi:hypothetical protein
MTPAIPLALFVVLLSVLASPLGAIELLDARVTPGAAAFIDNVNMTLRLEAPQFAASARQTFFLPEPGYA